MNEESPPIATGGLLNAFHAVHSVWVFEPDEVDVPRGTSTNSIASSHSFGFHAESGDERIELVE